MSCLSAVIAAYCGHSLYYFVVGIPFVSSVVNQRRTHCLGNICNVMLINAQRYVACSHTTSTVVNALCACLKKVEAGDVLVVDDAAGLVSVLGLLSLYTF